MDIMNSLNESLKFSDEIDTYYINSFSPSILKRRL